jgi:hypothetical protein
MIPLLSKIVIEREEIILYLVNDIISNRKFIPFLFMEYVSIIGVLNLKAISSP